MPWSLKALSSGTRFAGHLPVQAKVIASTAPSRSPEGRNIPTPGEVASCLWPQKNA